MFVCLKNWYYISDTEFNFWPELTKLTTESPVKFNVKAIYNNILYLKMK